MSNKYLLSITLVILFLSMASQSIGQCTLGAPESADPSATILTTNNGAQSFIPCVSGSLTSISFQVATASQSTNPLNKMVVVEGKGTNGKKVAEVFFPDIPFTDTGYTTVDFSAFHAPVDAGRTYTFYFTTISSIRYFRYDDIYADGGRYVGTTRISDNDLVFTADIAPATDYFVNGNTGVDTNDGSDFANAFATIQKVLDTATPGSNIYVASGTYYPTAGVDFDESGTVDAREFTFDIPSGYILYGGFDGTETTIDLSARDFVTNETILSGDLGVVSNVDNAYHVVYTKNVSSNTLLNGFTIEDGNADLASNGLNIGAGWYNDGTDGGDSSPSLVNVIIQNNEASSSAGGFSNDGSGGTANPTFSSCVFYNNDAGSGYGGAFLNTALSDPIETNPEFVNCTFYKNTAGGSGAAIGSFGFGGGDFVEFTITNSIFFDNVAATPQFSSFNTFYLSQSDANVSHSIFDDTVLPSGVTDLGDNLTNADPLFESEDSFVLANCSPAANAGDNSLVNETLDAQGNVRIQNTTVDIGAYELTDPIQPEIGLSTSMVDFGQGSEGQTLQETITITNTSGFGDLNITTSIDGDASFSINTSPTTIPEGGTADLIIDYTPTSIYVQFAEVTILSNDCNQESLTIDLSGDGALTPSYTLAHGEPYQLAATETSPLSRTIASLKNNLVHGLSISADGTKAFVLRSNSVFQMTMSTPFDIRTATDDGSFIISGEVSGPTAMAFDAIGMRLFIVGGTDLFQYSLTTAFDVMGTVAYDGSIAIPSVGQLPTGITFNKTGDRLLILDNDQDQIQNYQLEFPYDIVNGTLTVSSSAIISSDFSTPQDLQLSANEEEIFVVEDGKLIQYRAFSNVNGIFPNNIGEKEIPFSTTLTADAEAIHYTPDSRHLFILSRTTTGFVTIKQLSFERDEFDEENINDGSLGGSAELFLTGTTFVNAGSSLVDGTHFNVTNLPTGLVPEIAISADGETATFTFGGAADNNQSTHDVDDLSIAFTDAAFNGVAAADVEILGNNEYKILFEDNDITWVGRNTTAWDLGSNWSSFRVPNINENAIIPHPSSSLNRSPVIVDEQVINNIDIASGATVTLDAGVSIAIHGTATGSGSLITSREVVGDLGYSVIGATVEDQTVNDITPMADYIYGYDGLSNVFGVPSNLDEGAGYFVAFDETSPTITLSGKPVTGEVTRTVVYTNNGVADDYELVANPYNAAISRQGFVDENGPIGTGAIDGTIYLWQDGGSNLPNGTRAGNYLTVNASGTAIGGTFDGYIRSGQGFYVAANSTVTSTLAFKPAMQSINDNSNSSDGFFRKSEEKIRLDIVGEGQQDQLLIEFDESASVSIDVGYDAIKFMNPGLSFYSMVEKNALAIQTLPLSEDRIEIPIGYYVQTSGTYTISTPELAVFSGMEVVLIDVENDLEYMLTQDQSIDLFLTEGKNDSQLVLAIQPVSPLAISKELADFTIQYNDDEIKIEYASGIANESISIYTMSGKTVFNEVVDFSSGSAVIEKKLQTNQVYILRIGGKSKKFVIE